jgi:hypothetical protein
MDLVDRFGQIADPRQARWVQHPLPAVLALCAGAVVAGNSSFTAMAGWIAEVPIDVRVVVYSRCGRGAPTRCRQLPRSPRSGGW